MSHRNTLLAEKCSWSETCSASWTAKSNQLFSGKSSEFEARYLRKQKLIPCSRWWTDSYEKRSHRFNLFLHTGLSLDCASIDNMENVENMPQKAHIARADEYGQVPLLVSSLRVSKGRFVPNVVLRMFRHFFRPRSVALMPPKKRDTPLQVHHYGLSVCERDVSNSTAIVKMACRFCKDFGKELAVPMRVVLRNAPSTSRRPSFRKANYCAPHGDA